MEQPVDSWIAKYSPGGRADRGYRRVRRVQREGDQRTTSVAFRLSASLSIAGRSTWHGLAILHTGRRYVHSTHMQTLRMCTSTSGLLCE